MSLAVNFSPNGNAENSNGATEGKAMARWSGGPPSYRWSGGPPQYSKGGAKAPRGNNVQPGGKNSARPKKAKGSNTAAARGNASKAKNQAAALNTKNAKNKGKKKNSKGMIGNTASAAYRTVMWVPTSVMGMIPGMGKMSRGVYYAMIVTLVMLCSGQTSARRIDTDQPEMAASQSPTADHNNFPLPIEMMKKKLDELTKNSGYQDTAPDNVTCVASVCDECVWVKSGPSYERRCSVMAPLTLRGQSVLGGARYFVSRYLVTSIEHGSTYSQFCRGTDAKICGHIEPELMQYTYAVLRVGQKTTPNEHSHVRKKRAVRNPDSVVLKVTGEKHNASPTGLQNLLKRVGSTQDVLLYAAVAAALLWVTPRQYRPHAIAAFVAFILFVPVQSCEGMDKHAILVGKDSTEFSFTTTSGVCISGLIDSDPFVLSTDDIVQTGTVNFVEMVALVARVSAESRSFCPQVKADCPVCAPEVKELCHTEHPDRGWGNGCFWYSRGTTCIKLTPTVVQEDEVTVWRVDSPSYSPVITLDFRGTNTTYRMLPGLNVLKHTALGEFQIECEMPTAYNMLQDYYYVYEDAHHVPSTIDVCASHDKLSAILSAPSRVSLDLPYTNWEHAINFRGCSVETCEYDFLTSTKSDFLKMKNQMHCFDADVEITPDGLKVPHNVSVHGEMTCTVQLVGLAAAPPKKPLCNGISVGSMYSQKGQDGSTYIHFHDAKIVGGGAANAADCRVHLDPPAQCAFRLTTLPLTETPGDHDMFYHCYRDADFSFGGKVVKLTGDGMFMGFINELTHTLEHIKNKVVKRGDPGLSGFAYTVFDTMGTLGASITHFFSNMFGHFWASVATAGVFGAVGYFGGSNISPAFGPPGAVIGLVIGFFCIPVLAESPIPELPLYNYDNSNPYQYFVEVGHVISEDWPRPSATVQYSQKHGCVWGEGGLCNMRSLLGENPKEVSVNWNNWENTHQKCTKYCDDHADKFAFASNCGPFCLCAQENRVYNNYVNALDGVSRDTIQGDNAIGYCGQMGCTVVAARCVGPIWSIKLMPEFAPKSYDRCWEKVMSGEVWCHNFATVEVLNSTCQCECPDPWGGEHCEAIIDPCAQDKLLNPIPPPCGEGYCISGIYPVFTCSCPPNYAGQYCEEFLDPCNPNPCKYGNCTDLTYPKYSCQCPPGVTGDDCTEVTCYSECANGQCVGDPPTTCECEMGWSGPTCEQQLSGCDSSPCLHGNCVSLEYPNYKCECDNNYEGVNCEVDVCAAQCEHGSCDADNNCVCEFGYTGEFCDTDHCAFECVHGECKAGLCVCSPGFRGQTCNQEFCTPECQNEGFCIDQFCFCSEGWEGESCETARCVPSCVHGKCERDEVAGVSVCTCDDGWTGVACQFRQCEPKCERGECVDGKCKCPEGYEGPTCSEITCHRKCEHGKCEGTTCVCDRGFYGQYCDSSRITVCPYQKPLCKLFCTHCPSDLQNPVIKTTYTQCPYRWPFQYVCKTEASLPSAAKCADSGLGDLRCVPHQNGGQASNDT